jgi:Tol biopolymer transport system component
MSPSVSPDGKKITYSAADYEWNVVEVGLADGDVHTLIENGGTNISPDWAPSGTHFLFSAGGAVLDQEASGEEFSRRLVDIGDDNAVAARWSPDGARFVFVDIGSRAKTEPFPIGTGVLTHTGIVQRISALLILL